MKRWQQIILACAVLALCAVLAIHHYRPRPKEPSPTPFAFATQLTEPILDPYVWTIDVASLPKGEFRFLYVDRELMRVTGVGGNQVNVIRGWDGTQATPHASASMVMIVYPGSEWALGAGSNAKKAKAEK